MPLVFENPKNPLIDFVKTPFIKFKEDFIYYSDWLFPVSYNPLEGIDLQRFATSALVEKSKDGRNAIGGSVFLPKRVKDFFVDLYNRKPEDKNKTIFNIFVNTVLNEKAEESKAQPKKKKTSAGFFDYVIAAPTVVIATAAAIPAFLFYYLSLIPTLIYKALANKKEQDDINAVETRGQRIAKNIQGAIMTAGLAISFLVWGPLALAAGVAKFFLDLVSVAATFLAEVAIIPIWGIANIFRASKEKSARELPIVENSSVIANEGELPASPENAPTVKTVNNLLARHNVAYTKIGADANANIFILAEDKANSPVQHTRYVAVKTADTAQKRWDFWVSNRNVDKAILVDDVKNDAINEEQKQQLR